MTKSLKKGNKFKWNNQIVIIIGPKKVFGGEPWIGVVGSERKIPKPFYVKVDDLK